MSDAYRVATKILKPKNERPPSDKDPFDATPDPHFERSIRRDAIANHACLRSDLNDMGARRDGLIIALLNLSRSPEQFSISALGIAREADALTRVINQLSDGKYKLNEVQETSDEG